MIRIIQGVKAAAGGELEAAFRFRHRIFVEEAGWEALRRPDGLERDQFDDDEAVHFLLYGSSGLIGYQRLLPTTRPYLLSEIYPQLCDDAVPSCATVYEWTRFAVERPFRGDGRSLGHAGAQLVLAFVEWGMANGVKSVVVELEPIQMLKFVQCHFLAYPLGVAHEVNGRDVVAVQAHFDRRTRARLLTLQAPQPEAQHS